MNLNKIFLFILISAPLIMSFSFFKSKPRTHVIMAEEIQRKVIKTLEKRHQMNCIGEGGGMMGSVNVLALAFQIHHPMDCNEARERIVDCIQELLKAVNENVEIRPFLKNYPFMPKNVDIAIYTTYPNGAEVFDPFIRVASIYESDQIYFYTKAPDQSYGYKNSYLESYQEALTHVKSQRNKP